MNQLAFYRQPRVGRRDSGFTACYRIGALNHRSLNVTLHKDLRAIRCMSDELNVIFTGESAAECDDFILAVRKHARAHGKTRDNSWIAEELYTAFGGKALRWFVKQTPEVQGDWNLLQRALVDQWADDDGSDPLQRSGETFPSAPPAHGAIPSAAAAAPSGSASGLSGRTGRIRVRTGGLRASDKFLSQSTYSSSVVDPWRRGSFLLTSNAKEAMRVKLMPSEHGLWHLEMLAHPSGRKLVAGYFAGSWSGCYGFLMGVDTPSGDSLRGKATTYSGGMDNYEFRTAAWKLEDERYLSFVWSASESDGDKKRIPIVRRQEDGLILNHSHTSDGGIDKQVEFELDLLKEWSCNL